MEHNTLGDKTGCEVDDMITIEIYFGDLIPEKQHEILDAMGDNGNNDIIPIAILTAERKDGK